MRLSNDRDQEIIRSAIPNSSISTTSFISSIGNGEAIAFGEAVAVPMRMRFTRVEEKSLPKANGVGVKVTDETPDTVDLRNVVSRMRAMNGPDISSFQNAYTASIEVPGNAPMADDFNDASTFGRTGFEPASEIAEPCRSSPTTPPCCRAWSPPIRSLSGSIKSAASFCPMNLWPDPGPIHTGHHHAQRRALPSPMRTSPGLRFVESLLKKPLSSIIRK